MREIARVWYTLGATQALRKGTTMVSLGGWMVWVAAGGSVAQAASDDLADIFADAAAEFSVPEDVLLALAYEASRWDATVTSQWGGYGLFDLREPGEGDGPDIEAAATLLDLSPDDLIDDPEAQVRAAAALLARAARYTTADGGLPDADILTDWRDAVRAFSGRHEPNLQQLYADYIFSLLADGVPDDGSGLSIGAHDLSLSDYMAPPPPPGTCDYSGCYQFVSASTSNYSNYSRTASDISYIVVHTVQGSYSGCISWFQNSSAKVSAHYVVRSSDGQVTQMVDEEDVAWHAGNWDYNLHSVGIEHEGYIDAPSTWYTTAMYASSGALSADIAARNGIPVSRSYIIGHNEVPGATHTDPGSGWDWRCDRRHRRRGHLQRRASLRCHGLDRGDGRDDHLGCRRLLSLLRPLAGYLHHPRCRARLRRGDLHQEPLGGRQLVLHRPPGRPR